MRSSATSDLAATPRSAFSGNSKTSASPTSPSCAAGRPNSNIANLEKYRTQTQVGADIVASFETRLAAARQIEDARETLVEAIESLRLNFVNIRQGARLRRATRPIEVLQPIQALAQGRLDYLDSVLSYNRAQFQLKRAIGQAP